MASVWWANQSGLNCFPKYWIPVSLLQWPAEFLSSKDGPRPQLLFNSLKRMGKNSFSQLIKLQHGDFFHADNSEVIKLLSDDRHARLLRQKERDREIYQKRSLLNSRSGHTQFSISFASKQQYQPPTNTETNKQAKKESNNFDSSRVVL